MPAPRRQRPVAKTRIVLRCLYSKLEQPTRSSCRPICDTPAVPAPHFGAAYISSSRTWSFPGKTAGKRCAPSTAATSSPLLPVCLPPGHAATGLPCVAYISCARCSKPQSRCSPSRSSLTTTAVPSQRRRLSLDCRPQSRSTPRRRSSCSPRCAASSTLGAPDSRPCATCQPMPGPSPRDWNTYAATWGDVRGLHVGHE